MVDEEDLYKNPTAAFTDDTGLSMEQGPRFHKYTKFEKLKIFLHIKQIVWKFEKLRKKLGSIIIGNPPLGRGILINIPLAWMTEDQKKYWWEARRLMQQAGITCDSGMGCGGLLDLEFDWSLHGAIAGCKRCGYDSRKHIKESITRRIKQHHKNIALKKETASALDCRHGTCNCLNDKRGEQGF